MVLWPPILRLCELHYKVCFFPHYLLLDVVSCWTVQILECSLEVFHLSYMLAHIVIKTLSLSFLIFLCQNTAPCFPVYGIICCIQQCQMPHWDPVILPLSVFKWMSLKRYFTAVGWLKHDWKTSKQVFSSRKLFIYWKHCFWNVLTESRRSDMGL